MGLVRKTLSISTLGLVNFRSKKELLARAENDLASASDELDREHRAREAAEARVSVAERRTKAAELQALHAAKRAAKLRGKKGAQARTLLDRLNEAAAAAEPKLQEAGRKGRKAAKKAAKKARKKAGDAVATYEPKIRDAVEQAQTRGRRAAKKARKSAKAEAKKARKKADPYIEQARELIGS